jgi:excisionase family DNA binding protein
MSTDSPTQTAGAPRLLTVTQASRYLGIPTKTLYAHVAAQRITYVRLGDRGRIWFEQDALDRWIADHRVPAVGVERERPARPQPARPARDISELMPARRRFA